MSRRLDLFKFAGDDSEEEGEEVLPKALVELNELKSKTFSHGITKKSKRDLEREAEEKKRLEEEKAMALVNAEMEEAFAARGGPTSGSGMRAFGHAMKSSNAFVRAGGGSAAYVPPGRDTGRTEPSPRFPGSRYASDSLSAPPPQGRSSTGYSKPHGARTSSPPKATGHGKGKRAMDSFLEEMKSNQRLREERLGKIAKRGIVDHVYCRDDLIGEAREAGPSSRFPNEVETTNMFISNLPPDVTEHSLGQLFARRGAIATVKIMWPRGEDEMVAARRGVALTGFVSYMRRTDAERAIKEFDGFNWGGHILRIGWSKAIPIPSKALIEASHRSHSPEPRRNRAGSRSPDPQKRSRPRSPSSTASLPSGSGCRDTRRADREEDGSFADDGYASVYSSDSAEDSERERVSKGSLGRLSRRRFEALLRSLSGRRSEIARATEFALLRAEAADEVVSIVCRSLRVEDTPVPRKIARLHLVSDILHNSASPLPNVWRYRLAFEKSLPAVFAHFAKVYQSLLAYSGRISADIFRSQVGGILDIWERWIVFTSDVSEKLRRLLEGQQEPVQPDEDASALFSKKHSTEAAVSALPSSPSGNFKTSGFKSSFKAAIEPVTDPAELLLQEVLGGNAGQEEDPDLDGEAMEDIDGEGYEGVDGEAMDDLDGEAM